MKFQKYTKELLEEAAIPSLSIAEVLRRLKIPLSGGMHAHISKKIKKLEISTKHFLGQGRNWGVNYKGSKLKPKEKILVLHEDKNFVEKTLLLKRAMKEIGIEYICSICRNTPIWNNKELILQVDHIEGRRFDNRKEKVRFLCPNCHSQTDTFCHRNIARVAQRQRHCA